MKPLNEWTVEEIDELVDNTVGKMPLVGGKYAKQAKQQVHADRDHNGKVDLLEWLVKAQKALDLMELINKNVDFEKLADKVDDMDFIKDKPVVKAALHEAAKEIEHAQKLAEAQRLLEGNK